MVRPELAGIGAVPQIFGSDYRGLSDEPYDAIASIGMAEHVGASQIDLYAQSLFALLRPGGGLMRAPR